MTPETVTVCGVELRRHEGRPAEDGSRRVEYSAVRGDVKLIVEAVVSGDDATAEEEWEGWALVTYRWSSACGAAAARVTMPHAAGATPERCAQTLDEIVRSLADALGKVVHP